MTAWLQETEFVRDLEEGLLDWTWVDGIHNFQQKSMALDMAQFSKSQLILQAFRRIAKFSKA